MTDQTANGRSLGFATRQLAACDGPPDYTYKVAYEEAGALVERLEAISNSADLTI